MSKIILHAEDNVKATDTCNLCGDVQHVIHDRVSAGVKRTRVRLVNAETGEVMDDLSNKVTVSGSQFNAMAVFGITTPAVDFETYNEAMQLDNSVILTPGQERDNYPTVCLFSIADSGCGSTHNSIKVSTYTDRLKPAPSSPSSVNDFTSDMIMPFRFVPFSDDLSANLRKFYYGKKTFGSLNIGGTTGWIGYYFKKFDSEPMLHLRFADGTQITADNVYSVGTTQEAECYVEMRLRITRLDFRDYFEKVLGWDKARISSLSLNFAWYRDESDQYRYYQDITPYTILNFDYKDLQDLTVAMDVLYEIYF